MLRITISLALVTGAALLSGCNANQRRDTEFELKRVTQERDGVQGQLRDEQARSAALQKELEGTDADLKLAQAQVARLRETHQSLTKLNDELKSKLEQRAQRELKRPDVPISPLPATADNAFGQLAERLRERVWYDRPRGAISFANDRLFDSGSDAVRSEALPGLQALATVLARPELEEYEFIVVGHTDAAPITRPATLEKHPSNWHLSVHRAIAVKDVLVQAGVSAARVGVMGYGPDRPVSDDPLQNRRFEVFVVRKSAVQAFAPVTPPQIGARARP